MQYLKKAFLTQFNERDLDAAVDDAAALITCETMKRVIVEEVRGLGYRGPHMDGAWADAMRAFTGKVSDFKMFDADFRRNELVWHETQIQKLSDLKAAESQVQSRVWDRFFNKVFTNLETIREEKNAKGPKKE